MATILQANNLCKTFSIGGIMQHVLKNLDIRIEEGEFAVIMGSSGSGKSTLLYALSGMDKPSIGEIEYCGEHIENYSNDELARFRRKNCGFVFQDIFLNDNMSIMDNILVTGFMANKDKKAVIAKAKELLSEVGIAEDMFNKFPAQMSGGELQRVALVRATINDPQIVFADEPTGALNSAAGESVLNLFNKINKDGRTVVMVTHDIKTASRGDRLLYLKDGMIMNELPLGKYDSSDDEERKIKTTEFLTKMGW